MSWFQRTFDAGGKVIPFPRTPRLSEAELIDARTVGVYRCVLCNQRVVAHDGDWWDATFGGLHARTCTGEK